MFRRADRTVGDERAHRHADRVVPELEVEQVHTLGGVGRGKQGLRFERVEAERLVAQHGVTGGQRPTHVGAVQERRRVHRDQIDIGPLAQRGDTRVIARRDDVDDLAPRRLRERGCHDP